MSDSFLYPNNDLERESDDYIGNQQEEIDNQEEENPFPQREDDSDSDEELREENESKPHDEQVAGE